MSNFDLTFCKVYIYAKGWPGINLEASHESCTQPIIYAAFIILLGTAINVRVVLNLLCRIVFSRSPKKFWIYHFDESWQPIRAVYFIKAFRKLKLSTNSKFLGRSTLIYCQSKIKVPIKILYDIWVNFCYVSLHGHTKDLSIQKLVKICWRTLRTVKDSV